MKNRPAVICVRAVTARESKYLKQSCFDAEPATLHVSVDRGPQGMGGASYTATLLTTSEALRLRDALNAFLKNTPAAVEHVARGNLRAVGKLEA